MIKKKKKRKEREKNKIVEDILVPPEVGAHEVLEGWGDEFVQQISESKWTALSRLQQEKDEDQGRQEWSDHSATNHKQIRIYQLND